MKAGWAKAALIGWAVAGMFLAAYATEVTRNSATEARARLSDSLNASMTCRCVLAGSADDITFDVSIGQVTSTPTTAETLLVPARAACGPMRLRGWLGTAAP